MVFRNEDPLRKNPPTAAAGKRRQNRGWRSEQAGNLSGLFHAQCFALGHWGKRCVCISVFQ
jgi:hypothetical protein